MDEKDNIQNIIINLQDKIEKLIYDELRIYSNVKNLSFDIKYNYSMSYTHCRLLKTDGEWKEDLLLTDN
jgi:hypothetical protein